MDYSKRKVYEGHYNQGGVKQIFHYYFDKDGEYKECNKDGSPIEVYT